MSREITNEELNFVSKVRSDVSLPLADEFEKILKHDDFESLKRRLRSVMFIIDGERYGK